MIKIRYTGSSGVRIIDPYQWDESNDYVVAVDPATAADLIAYPHKGQFEVVKQKPSATDVKAIAKKLGVKESEITKLFSSGVDIVAELTLTDITGLSEERTGELNQAGVATVKALANLDDAQLADVIKKVGASRAEVTAWRDEARKKTA